MEEGNRLIITVLGHDRVGIIYGISGVLANANVNILDISQTILQGFFTMVMVVDFSQSTVDLAELKRRLDEKGRNWDCRLQCSMKTSSVTCTASEDPETRHRQNSTSGPIIRCTASEDTGYPAVISGTRWRTGWVYEFAVVWDLRDPIITPSGL